MAGPANKPEKTIIRALVIAEYLSGQGFISGVCILIKTYFTLQEFSNENLLRWVLAACRIKDAISAFFNGNCIGKGGFGDDFV